MQRLHATVPCRPLARPRFASACGRSQLHAVTWHAASPRERSGCARVRHGDDERVRFDTLTEERGSGRRLFSEVFSTPRSTAVLTACLVPARPNGDSVSRLQALRAFSSARRATVQSRNAREDFLRTNRMGLEPRKGCLKALGEREQLDLAFEDDASFQELRDMWIDHRSLDADAGASAAAELHTDQASAGDGCASDPTATGGDRQGESAARFPLVRGSGVEAGRGRDRVSGPSSPAPRLQVIERVRRLVAEAPERLCASTPPAGETDARAAFGEPFVESSFREAFAVDSYDTTQETNFSSGSTGAWRCEWMETNDFVCQFATRMTAKEILSLLALYAKLKALKPPDGSAVSAASLQSVTEAKRALYALTQALLRHSSPEPAQTQTPGRLALPILLESLTSTQLVMLLRHLVVLEFHHQLLLLHVFHLLPRRLLLLAQEARERDARQKGEPPPPFPDLALSAGRSGPTFPAPGRSEGCPRDAVKEMSNRQQNEIRSLASFIPWQSPVAFAAYGAQDVSLEAMKNCDPSRRKEALHMVALTFLGGSVAELARTCPSLSLWSNENTRTLVAIIEQLTLLNIHETSPVQLTVLATSVCGLHTATIRFLNALARRASELINEFSFSQLTLVANALARLHFAHGSLVKKVEAATTALKRPAVGGSAAPGAGRQLPAVRGKIVAGGEFSAGASGPQKREPGEQADRMEGANAFAELVADCDPRGLRSLWYKVALRAASALPKTVWRQQEFLDSSGTWVDVNETLALEQAEAAAALRATDTPPKETLQEQTVGRETAGPRGAAGVAEGWEGALGFPKGRGRFLPAGCLDLFKAAEISYDLSTSDDVVAYFDPAVRGGTWKRLFFPSSSSSLSSSLSLPSSPSSSEGMASVGEQTQEGEETFSLTNLPPSPAPACETAEGVRPFGPLRNEEIRQLINLLNSFARVVAAELLPLDDRDIAGELAETFPAWAARQAHLDGQKASKSLPKGAAKGSSSALGDADGDAASPSDFEHDVVDWTNVRKVCAAMVNAGVDTGAAQVDNPVFLLFTRAITELIARQEQMTAQGITSFMNAYSKVRLKGHGRFFFQLKPRILKLLPEFASHQISMALNAFSYFRFDDKEVVRGLVNEFMHRRHQGASSIAVSSVILSMAALGMREESVIRAMTQGNWITNSLFFNSLSTQGLTTLLFSLVCQDAVYEAATGSADLLNKILMRLHESALKRHGEAMLVTCARALFPCSFLTVSDHLRAVEEARKHRLTGVDMSSYIRPEFEKKWISTGTQRDGGRTLAWAVRPPPEILHSPPEQWSTGLKFLADQLFYKGRANMRAKIVPSGLHFQVAAVAHLLGYRVLNEISVFPYSIDIVVLPDVVTSESRIPRTVEKADSQRRGKKEAFDASPGLFDMQQTDELRRLATEGVQSDGALTRMSKVMSFRYGGYGRPQS
ncbi:hypothetical protein TGVAND_318400 [Toxoplasma gondii VAND]|uniref:Uncharacterized protein n=1 Tax=Toxoplasma gondii VAND TaxID=933077 RepID=A0A086PUQ2_TOXGO|nr:hypothetical protein TGVAND_318400 [Toxoplasma gondii VAND]